MRAYVFETYKSTPNLREVSIPRPGPSDVLLRVAASGACHSDLHVFRSFDAATGPSQLAPSFTLGHEVTGWVEELGSDVHGLEVGSAQIVYGPIGCGHCDACQRLEDNYCLRAATNPALAIGLGRDGGMADFVAVPARNLVSLGTADPIAAAPLADAGLTPYHAIKPSLDALSTGRRAVLIIGAGGLGQMAAQLASTLTTADVIVSDVKKDALDRAASRGAVALQAGADFDAALRDATAGRGADLVLDFVGSDSTLSASCRSVAQHGRIVAVGAGRGRVPWGFGALPYEVELTTTYWGSLPELHDVVGMFSAGLLQPDVTHFSLDDVSEAYRQLEDGSLEGRAVVTPSDSPAG